MDEIKDEINWENYLDNYFDLFKPLIDKEEYLNGLTINYSKNDIYVWCNLDKQKTKIKKLEFGRYVNDNLGSQGSNWIKGVLINNKHSYVTFLQTSFDSEEGKDFEFEFDNVNKKIINRFLNTPCLSGWTEEEYSSGKDKFYKIIVRLDSLKWTIPIKDIGEQDIPMITDKIDIWLRIKFGDAFWNNSTRKIDEIFVTPMNIEENNKPLTKNKTKQTNLRNV